ncbi:heavy metal translocating P-type ATPase [Clostridium caldaquaticum]|uniref:heavy metal translocating P-type ATPase n=1 Tax=Clostridium caldaquaticum TaxID=2940653 RepID=UPI0025747D1D|nr:heavy metal translocating P-type ATPase [Clostridium caldaquaticum]
MSSPIKKEFILEGLGCANCAAKMERKINELDEVSKASINFATKTLTMEIDEEFNNNTLINKIVNIVKGIEAHVTVKEKHKHSFNEYSHHIHEHEHTHDHSYSIKGQEKELIKLGIGVVLYLIAVIFKISFWAEFILFIASYVFIGGDVLLRAFKNIGRGQIFDENFLMSIATIGAFAIGEYPEAVSVMLFYKIGEFFQDMAVNKSRKSIESLMDIRPDYANLKINDKTIKVSPEEVKAGDLIIVKPGEKIPLDGKVAEGFSMLDTSALTGESLPREVKAGDNVLSGFINKNGLLTIEVTKEFSESTVFKILDLVQNAGSRKAQTENFITKFARYYTPAVVFSALALAFIPPILIQGVVFSQWIYRALVFLVVSCPCALVISIPLSFFGGIGGASKKGILVKGGNYLEALNNVETVVFDKTGTLTKGVFKVTEINSVNGVSKEELLEYAAFAESFSNHPIAVSILKAYGRAIDRAVIKDYNEIAGYGISVRIRDREVLAGNSKLMKNKNIKFNEAVSIGTAVHVVIDNRYAGYIIISDEIKEDSAKAISLLKSLGVKKTVMLTGDNKAAAEKVAAELKIDEVYSELLPDGKVREVERLQEEKSSKGKLIFAGDGINDAPVLARADIGIAMGGIGSDAAIEAADVVIMTDEPSKIAEAVKIAKKTRIIVLQNIVFALAVKILILIFGAFGTASMWEAVFADAGVALIAVLNSMRSLKVH